MGLSGSARELNTALAVGMLVTTLLVMLAPDPMFFYPDSRGYLEVAQAMSTGDFWTTRATPQLPFAWAVRTPGYPLLLCLAALVEDNLGVSIRLLHAVMGGLAAAALVLAAPLGRSLFLRGLAGAIFLVCSLTIVGDDFRCVLTEWVAFTLLVPLLARCFRWGTSRQASELAPVATIASLAALTRPVLIVACAVPLLLFIFLPRRELTRGAVAVLSGSVLLLAWFTFNTYRFGKPSLTPFLGHNVIGVAGFLPAPDQAALPSGPVREFGVAFAAQRVTPPSLLLPFASDVPLSQLMEVYNRNIHVIAAGITKAQGLSIAEADRVYGIYSWRAILAAPHAYLSYVRYVLKPFFQRSRLGLAAACAALLSCVFLRLRPHVLTLGLCLYLHLAVVVSTSLVETYLERYTRVTLGCCWLFAALGLLASCVEVGRRWRGVDGATQR